MSWEKEVLPSVNDTPLRTGVPRQLPSIDGVMSKAWDPNQYADLLETMKDDMQEYVVYPPPLFIMSPRTRIYLAKDIVRFKGYLSKLEPCQSEEGEAEVEVTITVSGDKS